MAKDDRFTVIVVALVTLITAGAFLWSHWGSPAIRTDPVVIARSLPSEDQTDESIEP